MISYDFIWFRSKTCVCLSFGYLNLGTLEFYTCISDIWENSVLWALHWRRARSSRQQSNGRTPCKEGRCKCRGETKRYTYRTRESIFCTLIQEIQERTHKFFLFISFPLSFIFLQDVVAMLQQDMIAVQLSGDQTGLAFVNDVRVLAYSLSRTVQNVFLCCCIRINSTSQYLT